MRVIFIEDFSALGGLRQSSKFYSMPYQALFELKDAVSEDLRQKCKKGRFTWYPDMVADSEYKIVLLHDPDASVRFMRETLQASPYPEWKSISDRMIGMTSPKPTRAEEITDWLAHQGTEAVRYVVIGHPESFVDPEGNTKGFSLSDDLTNYLFLYHSDQGFVDSLSWRRIRFALFSSETMTEPDPHDYCSDLGLVLQASADFRRRGLEKINILFLDLDGVVLIMDSRDVKIRDSEGESITLNLTAIKNLLDIVARSDDTTRLVISSARRYLWTTWLTRCFLKELGPFVIGSTPSDPAGQNDRGVEIQQWLKTYSPCFGKVKLDYLVIDDSRKVLASCRAVGIEEERLVACHSTYGFMDAKPLQQPFTRVSEHVSGVRFFVPPQTHYGLRPRAVDEAKDPVIKRAGSPS